MIVKRKLYSEKGKESSTGEKAGKALLSVGTGLGAYAGGHLVRSYHQGYKSGLVNEAGGATNYLKEVRKASKLVTIKDISNARRDLGTSPDIISKNKNILNSLESMKFARGAGKAALATAGIGGAMYLGSKLSKKKER